MPKKSDDSLDTLWIETLQAVLLHQTYDAAAKALNCSQSTISNRIAKLEGWLGAPLFRRDEKQALPNDMAYSFASTAVPVLEKLKEFRAARPDFDAVDAPNSCRGAQPDEDAELEQKLANAKSKWWLTAFSKGSD